jgi:hypothetical protein
VRRRELGRLKWGVGKLIAHAPVTPVVIPLYHTGMQSVVPLHPISHKVRATAALQCWHDTKMNTMLQHSNIRL